jgi:hypothetical protein
VPQRPQPERDAINPFTVTFVGSLQEGKGVLEVLKTAKILKDQGHGSRFNFRIVGKWFSDEFEAQTRRMHEECELEGLVELVGQLTGDAKWDAYYNSDVFFFPTHYASEATPIVIMEALGAGLHILSTEWAGIPNMLDGCQSATLHPVRSPDLYATSLIRLAEDPNQAARDFDHSREFYQNHFVPSRFIERVNHAFLKVSNAKASPAADALERRPCQRISPTHSVVWPPDMRPFLITRNPTRPYWIFPNVKPCRLMILLATNSMIKIITLPSNAAMPGRMAFPSPDEIHHAISQIPPKRDQGVQMVGHDQGHLHPPTAFLVVKFHRIKQLTHHLRIRQRGLTAFFAVDRDEKCRVIRNPNRRTMRPPSGLTNGHGVMIHWKNSNCIRPMSKRILA